MIGRPKQAEGREPSDSNSQSRLQEPSNRQNNHTGRLAPYRYDEG